MCLSEKQIIPPMSMRPELKAVSGVDLLGGMKFPIKPRLKINSSAPKIMPLIPASDNSRFVVRE